MFLQTDSVPNMLIASGDDSGRVVISFLLTGRIACKPDLGCKKIASICSGGRGEFFILTNEPSALFLVTTSTTRSLLDFSEYFQGHATAVALDSVNQHVFIGSSLG